MGDFKGNNFNSSSGMKSRLCGAISEQRKNDHSSEGNLITCANLLPTDFYFSTSIYIILVERFIYLKRGLTVEGALTLHSPHYKK